MHEPTSLCKAMSRGLPKGASLSPRLPQGRFGTAKELSPSRFVRRKLEARALTPRATFASNHRFRTGERFAIRVIHLIHGSLLVAGLLDRSVRSNLGGFTLIGATIHAGMIRKRQELEIGLLHLGLGNGQPSRSRDPRHTNLGVLRSTLRSGYFILLATTLYADKTCWLRLGEKRRITGPESSAV